MASEKRRVIRKDFQEVLRWLRRNRATLRRKYYSSSNAKSQNDSFDNVLRYLTAIDEGDYWKSPSPDSEGTEIRLRDLLDSFNDRRAGGTIINVFTEFKVKVILEHASWEVGLERMIEFVSHGKNKPEKQKEKKQGPDEPSSKVVDPSSEPIHPYSEIIYSDYENYPPKLFKKDLCRTILWCRAFDGQNDSDLVLFGAQSMSDELGVDLDYVVVESEEDLRKKLAAMTIARRGKDVDGMAFILEGFTDPEGWERMIKREGIKYELKVCGILKIGTGKANDDVRLDDEEVGRLIYESIFPELIKESEWSPRHERDDPRKREQHKKLLAVAGFDSGDESVTRRIQGFSDEAFPDVGKFKENVRRIDGQTPLEPSRVIFAPTADLAEKVRLRLRELPVSTEQGWSPMIFTAGMTPEILRLLKNPDNVVKAACGFDPYYYGRMLVRTAWRWRGRESSDPIRVRPVMIDRSAVRATDTLRDLVMRFPELRLDEYGWKPWMTAFCPMSHKASPGAKLRFPDVWHAKTSKVGLDDSIRAEKSVKPVDRLVRTEGLYSLRADDRDALTKYWKTPDTKLVALIGPGGIGKSSLVQLWLEEMTNDQTGLLGGKVPILAFTLQANSGAGRGIQDFYDELLDAFGEKVTKASYAAGPGVNLPKMKADKVLECLRDNETLLIIDRLESHQHPGISQKGNPTDESLRDLIEGLASSNHGMCVVTSRVGLWDSEKLEKAAVERTYITREIDPLKEKVEVEVLGRELGIKEEPSGKDLKDLGPVVHNLCLGNPYVIKLLGSVLRHRHGGNVSKWQDVNSLVQDVKLLAKTDPHREASAAVLTSYEEWLGGSDEGKQELAALRLLGFFNGPAPISALAKLRREPIHGLNDGLDSMSDENWSKLLEFLQGLRLIKLSEEEVTSHQILREFFEERIKQSDLGSEGQPSRWQKGCSILFDYYRGPQDGSAAEVEVKINDLFLAVGYGCQARRYMEAFITYWRDLQKGSPRLALYSHGKVSDDVRALEGFFHPKDPTKSNDTGVMEADWSKPVELEASETNTDMYGISWPDVQAFLPLQAGLQHWHMGKYERSIASLEAGKEKAVSLQRWEDAAENIRRIAENLVEMGRIGEARERMSEGIQYADRAAEEKTWRLQEVFDKQLGIPPSPDASVINPPGFEQVDTRVLLGKILHQLGIWDKAAEAFAEAKEKNGIVRPQLNCLCDVWGFWYWDFKIDHNIITANNNFTDIEFGIEESRKNQPHAILLMNGLHELALARIHMIKKDEQTGNVSKVSLDSALLHGMKAVEDLKRANQYPHYLYGLEVLAEIHLLANQTEMAKDVLDTLKAKLELGPSTMTPRKIDYALLMADYNLRQGNCDRNKVKAELEVIQRQIENMGYDRRKAWLKDRVRKCSPQGGHDDSSSSPSADS